MLRSADSLMGKGALQWTKTSCTRGMLGMHGTKASNLGVTECDLLIAVGARFSDRVVGQAQELCKKCKDYSDRCGSG